MGETQSACMAGIHNIHSLTCIGFEFSPSFTFTITLSLSHTLSLFSHVFDSGEVQVKNKNGDILGRGMFINKGISQN